MALSKELEDLIVGLPAEEQAPLRASLEKHEVLRQKFEGGLRQSDYDRKMNEVKATEKAAAEAKERADAKYKENQEWFDANKPILDKAVKERGDMFQQVKDLEAKLKIEAARVPTGDGKVDQNAIVEAAAERLKTMGVMPDADGLRRLVIEEASKLAATERENFLKQTLPASLEFTMTIQEIAQDHRDEFKEKFDRPAFIKFINEKGLAERPPRETYDAWVADRRSKAHDEELIAATEKRVKSEQVPGTGTTAALGLPGASAVPEDGAMVEYLKAQKGPAMGTGASEEAAKAAAELRAEGKI